jgi:hypothetical protein
MRLIVVAALLCLVFANVEPETANSVEDIHAFLTLHEEGVGAIIYQDPANTQDAIIDEMSETVPILLVDGTSEVFVDNLVAGGVDSLPWVIGFDDKQPVLMEALATGSSKKMATLKRMDDAEDAANAANEEAETPAEPETLAEPETPEEPETPVEPEAVKSEVIVDKPETPTETEPETPTETDPEIPAETELETPAKTEPKTPAETEPETPSEEDTPENGGPDKISPTDHGNNGMVVTIPEYGPPRPRPGFPGSVNIGGPRPGRPGRPVVFRPYGPPPNMRPGIPTGPPPAPEVTAQATEAPAAPKPETPAEEVSGEPETPAVVTPTPPAPTPVAPAPPAPLTPKPALAKVPVPAPAPGPSTPSTPVAPIGRPQQPRPVTPTNPAGTPVRPSAPVKPGQAPAKPAQAAPAAQV